MGATIAAAGPWDCIRCISNSGETHTTMLQKIPKPLTGAAARSRFVSAQTRRRIPTKIQVGFSKTNGRDKERSSTQRERCFVASKEQIKGSNVSTAGAMYV